MPIFTHLSWGVGNMILTSSIPKPELCPEMSLGHPTGWPGPVPLKIGEPRAWTIDINSAILTMAGDISFAGFSSKGGGNLKVYLRGLMGNDDQWWSNVEYFSEQKLLWFFSPGVHIWSSVIDFGNNLLYWERPTNEISPAIVRIAEFISIVHTRGSPIFRGTGPGHPKVGATFHFCVILGNFP